MADRVACVAFPAEAAAEMRDERGCTLDDPGNDTMQVPPDEDLSKAVDREKRSSGCHAAAWYPS